ncbi:hypothetical protein ACFX1Q_042618 [Malus domestica]
MTTLCLVPSMAASQARRSSWSSALDFAIAGGGGGAALGGSQSDCCCSLMVKYVEKMVRRRKCEEYTLALCTCAGEFKLPIFSLPSLIV